MSQLLKKISIHSAFKSINLFNETSELREEV